MERIPLTKRQREVAAERFGDSGAAQWDRHSMDIYDAGAVLDALSDTQRKRSAPANLKDKILGQVSQMPYDCTKCGGSGTIKSPATTSILDGTCPACRGTGKHLGL